MVSAIVQVDKKFNLSLKDVKDSLNIQPHDTFSIQKVNTRTITLKKIKDVDPFIEGVKNPANLRNKKIPSLIQLEDDLWSA